MGFWFVAYVEEGGEAGGWGSLVVVGNLLEDFLIRLNFVKLIKFTNLIVIVKVLRLFQKVETSFLVNRIEEVAVLGVSVGVKGLHGSM